MNNDAWNKVNTMENARYRNEVAVVDAAAFCGDSARMGVNSEHQPGQHRCKPCLDLVFVLCIVFGAVLHHRAETMLCFRIHVLVRAPLESLLNSSLRNL